MAQLERTHKKIALLMVALSLAACETIPGEKRDPRGDYPVLDTYTQPEIGPDGPVLVFDEDFGSRHFAKATAKCGVTQVLLKFVGEPPQVAAGVISAQSKAGVSAASPARNQTFGAVLDVLERRAYMQNGNNDAGRTSVSLTKVPVNVFNIQADCSTSAFLPSPLAPITDVAGAETAQLIGALPNGARNGSRIYLDVHVKYRLTVEGGAPYVDWYRRSLLGILTTNAAGGLEFQSLVKDPQPILFR